MTPITLTCPFTGLSFEAMKTQDQMTLTNPLTQKQIPIKIKNGFAHVPMTVFTHIATLNATETALYLNVSRQRIDQLVKAGKLLPRYINSEPIFIMDDVIEYAQTRKNGRPRKD